MGRLLEPEDGIQIAWTLMISPWHTDALLAKFLVYKMQLTMRRRPSDGTVTFTDCEPHSQLTTAYAVHLSTAHPFSVARQHRGYSALC